jgi:glycosyltransferase involved in cell wall biosynthesis
LSDNESFGLYIAEAMSSGAIVLRTDVGGREETLKDGLNGFVLAGTVEDLEAKLLLLLDRSRTSDLELQAMSQQSSAMAARFVEKGYPELRF